MATESMKIVIGADVSKGVAGLNNLNQSLAATGKASQQASAAFSKIAPGANSAAFALTNVGRVAQDIPFGFVGIQNNLNPLLESFQRLKAETGSTKGALKALGSSLTGAGGIGLALSVVSSAILIFQNGIAGFNRKSKEAKEAADDLAKSIRSISSIEGEAVAGVQGQLAQVNALASAVADSNKPYEERKRALEELKQINKAYFNDLKIEDAATGALTKTVQEYTKALVNSAIQKQFVDEIAKVAKAVAESDEKVRKAKDRRDRAIAEETKTVEKFSAVDADGVQISNKARKATDERVEAEKAFLEVRDSSVKLLEQQAVLEDNLNKAVAVGLQFKDLNTGKTTKEVDLLKKRLEALEKIKDVTTDLNELVGLEEEIFDLKVKITLRDAAKNGLSKQETDLAIKGFREQLQNAFEAQAIALEAIPKVRFRDVQRVEIPTDIESKIAKATGFEKKIPEITIPQARIRLLGFERGSFLNSVEAIVNDLNNAIRQTIAKGAVDAFSSIGEAFGESLVSADFGTGLKKAAQSILNVIGGVLQEIGKQVISAALAIKALKATLEKFAIANPGLAVIAGIGLVALGSALKNIKFDGPKFAEGGIVSSPVIGQIGEKFKPEVIIPLERLPQMLRSFSGGEGAGIQIIPFINNEGLSLAVKRGDRRAGRKF